MADIASNIVFEDTGLSVPQASEVLSAVESEWNTAFGGSLNLDASTPQGQIMAAEAAAKFAFASKLLWLMNQFDPETATGVWQDALAKIYFITRNPAEPTTVSCTCTGLAGVVLNGIATGSPAQARDTSGNVYSCTDTVTIGSNGTVTAQFQCTEDGPIACPAHALNRIVTVVSGWDAIDNAAAGTEGTYAESRADFEKRRYNSVAINARDSVGSVYANVGMVDGVVALNVLTNRENSTQVVSGVSMAAHSVFVCAQGGTDADVAKAIYDNLSAGCAMVGTTSVTVTDDLTGASNVIKFSRPTAVSVYFQVSVDVGATSQADLIKETIIEDFYGRWTHRDGSSNARCGIGETIRASRFYTALVEAGVLGFVGVQLSTVSGTYYASIDLNGDQIPSVSAETISVVLVS